MELWEWRANAAKSEPDRRAELSGFAAWVRTGHFPTAWWLAELSEVLGIQPLRLRIGLGEALAGAAGAGHAGRAQEIATALIADRSEYGTYEVAQHLPAILATALSDEDAEVRAAAESLMDSLGRQGQLDLADRVAAVQAESGQIGRS